MKLAIKTGTALTLGAALSALLAAGPSFAAPFVYIPNGSGGQIEVVDVATGTVIDRFGGLEAVHGLAGTPDGKYLIAGSYSERAAGGAMPPKPKSVSQKDHEIHHAKKPAGQQMADQVSTVSVLDRKTGEILRAIDVPGAVHHVSVSADGRFAGVTHPATDSVSVIDLNSYQVVATIKTGSLPNYMQFSPDGAMLYVSNAGDNNIAVIGTRHWKVMKTIATGEAPEHMVLSPDGKTLYVNNNDEGSVGVIDLAEGRMTRRFGIGERLHGIDLADGGSALLVAERDGDSVARVNLLTGQVVKRAMGPEPYHMTAIPGTGLAFVSSSDAPVMRIIGQGDLAERARISLGDIGHQMVVAGRR